MAIKSKINLFIKIIFIILALALLSIPIFNKHWLREKDIVKDLKKISPHMSIVRQVNYKNLKVIIYDVDINNTRASYGHVVYRKSILNRFIRIESGSGSSTLNIAKFKLEHNRYILMFCGENINRDKKKLQYEINNTTYIEDISKEETFLRLYERRYEEDIDAHDFKFID